MSVEKIGRALRMSTKALKLPVAKLLQAEQVRTKGRRRGTKYFAAAAAPKATAGAKPPKAAAGPKGAMAERMAKMRAARAAKVAAK